MIGAVHVSVSIKNFDPGNLKTASLQKGHTN